ncbi:hypothetical protein GH714_019945 [Hevea brasiliensis]|uniref:Pentacotripeptide-repeat region of PRORP domain-containing protein n=1 Tax=Hevea brasiliensis TaxID=3981 RepID=A0A6A6N6S6_HEVBR|nr:hypothetical protein GH714_019945 [Hevea brasiliensis]
MSLPQFDSYAYGAMLRDCIQTGDLFVGKTLHCEILKKGNCLDLFAHNILLDFYVKSDALSDASKIFDEMPERNTISFVTLIQGYAQSFQLVEAFELFFRLHREGHELNPFVFTTILKLIIGMEWEKLGYCIHACIFKLGLDSNAFVGTALIDAYSVCGHVDSARQVFDAIAYKDMVSWTGMVACYAENDHFEDSLQLFSQMRMAGFRPNHFTFTGVLKACIGLEAFDVGKGVHGCALKLVMNLIFMVENSMELFMESPNRNEVAWNTMIVAYVQSGDVEKALSLFKNMLACQVQATEVTYSSALCACASLAAMEPGIQIHSLSVKTIYDRDTVVGNALIDMYAKCGSIKDARLVFDMLNELMKFRGML